MARRISLKTLSLLVFSTIFVLSFNTARAYEPNDDKPTHNGPTAANGAATNGEAHFDAGKLMRRPACR